jgi:hypothetical protein
MSHHFQINNSLAASTDAIPNLASYLLDKRGRLDAFILL